MPTQDIRYLTFKQIYTQCKHLLVPEFIGNPLDFSTRNPERIAPIRFETDPEIEKRAMEAGLDATALKDQRTADYNAYETEVRTKILPVDADNRMLRSIHAGYRDTTTLKTDKALPALMLQVGSGEYSLQRQDLHADLLPRRDVPITTLNAEPKRMILTLRLVLAELPPDELYQSDRGEVNLEKSRPGRVFAIWNQLRQVLDASYFRTQTQTLPQYAQRTEVIRTDISSGEVQESVVEDTVMDFRFEVIFTQQIMRS